MDSRPSIAVASEAPPSEAGSASANASSTTTGRQPRLRLPPSCDPPDPNNPGRQLVWIVFGGTGHIGRSLVKSALAHGDKVTTVGRTFESTPEAMVQQNPDCLGALCDVRVRESVQRVVDRTLERFERVDVVANCSGYGVIGACEDQDEHDIRNQFETNFMGTLHIIQASLPYFRSQAAGRYLIFSSTAGALGVPGLGPYCATKYAVEGLIEAMLYEVDAFNVKATLVEPGLVRRDDPEVRDEDPLPPAQETSSQSSPPPPPPPPPRSQNQQRDGGAGSAPSSHPPLPMWGHFLIKPASEPYSSPTSPAQHAKRMVQWIGDKQPSSAVKCAELAWQLAHCSYPPLRLLLGSYAIESIRDRLRCVTEELEDWKHLNFPVAPDPLAASASQPPQQQQQPQQEKGKEKMSSSPQTQQQPPQPQGKGKEKQQPDNDAAAGGAGAGNGGDNSKSDNEDPELRADEVMQDVLMEVTATG